jgi:hypothetical protein
MGETDLSHKILAIAEEKGAEHASYALKLLQSEGELTIASTGKDPQTGRLVTQEYRVQGPVMIFLTTTAIEVDEELLNRCIVLTVDEGREQTRAIHERQRLSQTLEGLLQQQERGHVITLHQNAQRLLRALFVANPFAKELHFNDRATRSRRDHMKYLTLMRSVALLHQYQRPVKEVEHRGGKLRYVEVTRDDIAIADRLCGTVLGHDVDDVPPQTRKLLGLIDALVSTLQKERGMDRADVRFSRRDVREHTGWGHTQLKVHLGRLEELEYLHVHAGGARKRIVYELVYAANWAGNSDDQSGPGRPLVGGQDRPDFQNDSDSKRELVGPSIQARSGKRANGQPYRSELPGLDAAPSITEGRATVAASVGS